MKIGKLDFKNTVQAYDKDYKFCLFIDTGNQVSNETVKQYQNKIYGEKEGLILLKEKAIFISSEGVNKEIEYKSLLDVNEIEVKDKKELLDTINEVGLKKIVVIYFFSSFAALYVSGVITILSDLCLIAVFGYIAAILCGVRFKIPPMFSLSIYSLTLSIVLKMIYNVVFILTGFTIKYFNMMYLLIAYVYIVAAIFMIKYDLIKQSQELQKIIEIQNQVKKEENDEELEKEKKEEKEDKKEEPEVEENKEPDGSEI